jgi:hypothetical protein
MPFFAAFMGGDDVVSDWDSGPLMETFHHLFL